MNWFDKRFRLEEINGAGRCPTYLYRWTLFRATNWRIYLHHFVGEDWSRDLHDHPKRFISIGLWGSYIELTPLPLTLLNSLDEKVEVGEEPPFFRARQYRAPWIRTFSASYQHRLIAQNCWTLVIVLKPVREWGFWHGGRFIHWRDYVKSELADKMKACGDD